MKFVASWNLNFKHKKFQNGDKTGPDYFFPRPLLPYEDDDAPLYEQQQARPPHTALCHELQVRHTDIQATQIGEKIKIIF